MYPSRRALTDSGRHGALLTLGRHNREQHHVQHSSALEWAVFIEAPFGERQLDGRALRPCFQVVGGQRLELWTRGLKVRSVIRLASALHVITF